MDYDAKTLNVCNILQHVLPFVAEKLYDGITIFNKPLLVPKYIYTDRPNNYYTIHDVVGGEKQNKQNNSTQKNQRHAGVVRVHVHTRNVPYTYVYIPTTYTYY